MATYLSGFGASIPNFSLTNQELESFVETTDQWIVDRTGIKSRHIIRDDTVATDLAAQAAKQALDNVGMDVSELTHIINATCTPEYLCPSNACIVASKLGVKNHIMSFDLNAACSGFVYALEVARGLVAVKPESKILVVGVEALSKKINWEDRGTCVLFADGAGAVIVSGQSLQPKKDICEAVLEDVISMADGDGWHLLTLGGGSAKRYELGEGIDSSHFIKMNGREIFKFAVRNMSRLCSTILEKNNYTLDDIDLLVPHQANLRIIESVGDRLKIDRNKVFVNVDTYGNTSAASVPLALADAIAQGRVKKGMRVLVVAFGGGLTWAATVFKF